MSSSTERVGALEAKVGNYANEINFDQRSWADSGKDDREPDGDENDSTVAYCDDRLLPVCFSADLELPKRRRL
jgi:hypothetical protein